MGQRVLLGGLLVALVAVGAWLALRKPGLQPGSVDRLADTLARERAAAEFEAVQLGAARAALAPLVARRDAALEDLVRAAVIEFHDKSSGAPEELFARIRARDPRNPVLAYMSGRLALETGDFERALEQFQAVQKTRPDDLPAQLGEATALSGLGRDDEADAILLRVVAGGIAQGGTWYVQAVYRLMRSAELAGRAEQAQHYTDLYTQLQALGYRASAPLELDRGNLAIVLPPQPRGNPAPAAAPMPEFALEPALAPELADARELLATDLDGDGDVDFLAACPSGVLCAVHDAGGYRIEPAIEGSVDMLRAFDLGNDDTLDLLAVRGNAILVFDALSAADVLLKEPQEGSSPRRWSSEPIEIARLPGPPQDVLLVDFDHEGDLDVLAVGSTFGMRLLRNDGAAPRTDDKGEIVRGVFTDVTEDPKGAALTWCASEDFDNDHDVDLLLGGPVEMLLLDSRRSNGFVDVATDKALPEQSGMRAEPLIADLDGDARPDLLEPGEPALFWRQRGDGSFASEPTKLSIPGSAALLAADLDLDGAVDILWAAADGAIHCVCGLGSASARSFEIGRVSANAAALVCADVDGDLDNDLALCGPQGLEILRCAGPVGHAARIQLLGLKDNRRGVGAVVEARSRALYRRIYWRGEAELVGCGPNAALDVVRITWPNGIVQTRLDVPPTSRPFLDAKGPGVEQSGNLPGSCPFLYAWNGATYGFITDVLGGTPLGLPMAPGMLVAPDHDEFVLVRGSQLVPRDGVLELQLTEELREVTYLDRARLDVVDHPAGVEIQPNERFSFPPFPEPHVHTAREPLAPRTAFGSDGRDWAPELAAIDDVHARPFEPLGPQLTGLARPYWLELDFDPERVRDAKLLRLFFTGWFQWSDASVNMAGARTPGVEFVPPVLQVRDPQGEWVDAGPPIGFPAGKTKTMVIDVTALLAREDPRLRLRSTLCLSWDSIRLAVDGDDAPLSTTPLEVSSAKLWARGFSLPLATGRSDSPERFEWDALAQTPQWDQHPGRYTRYGEVAELLGEVDDRFVILGAGDALTLRFDARALPALGPGQERDYLLFLDGWAKDRDPNTIQALEVEPLPFHAMSGYPYRTDEHFPDDLQHHAWRSEWNTRAARQWIVPLAPAREAAWALAAPR